MEGPQSTVSGDRIRMNLSTNAKGRSQVDITVEVGIGDLSDKDASLRVASLLGQLLADAELTAANSGFPLVKEPVPTPGKD